jgi:hypothetical protein
VKAAGSRENVGAGLYEPRAAKAADPARTHNRITRDGNLYLTVDN